MKATKRPVLYEVPKFRVRCISGHKCHLTRKISKISIRKFWLNESTPESPLNKVTIPAKNIVFVFLVIQEIIEYLWRLKTNNKA